MDLRKLKTLIELVETSGIAELEIQEGEERVRITRSLPAGAPQAIHAVTAPVPAALSAPQLGVPGAEVLVTVGVRVGVVALAPVTTISTQNGLLAVAPIPKRAPAVFASIQ